MQNYMELLVDKIFKDIQNLNKDCMSEKCIYNIKTHALNHLPSYYLNYETSEAEKIAFYFNKQRNITVLAKIIEATEYICSNCSEQKIDLILDKNV